MTMARPLCLLAGRLPCEWRAPLARLALVWLVLIGSFLADWQDMARQWWDSSTYNHILLIPAIIGWMVWQRLPQLAKLAPVVWWPGLVLFGCATILWVLGSFSGLSLARQAGVVAMLGAGAVTLLGPKVSAGLVFPLAYLTLLVPFGDELIPPLQSVTAFLTIGLTRLSGIPAAIDGVFIDTPAGLFEVAEACSGVKFLVAMIAFGLLVANVCFVRWPRRIIFMAFCLIVPILANGVRAWGTILVAQYVGAEKATGFDHIVYGWGFFGLVIALVLAGGWHFFDRMADDPMIDADAIAASPVLAAMERLTLRSGKVLAILGAILLAGISWAWAANKLEAKLPEQIFLPQVSGWSRVDYTPQVWWEPRATGARHRLLGRYRDEKGHEVDVFFALFAEQREGGEAGGFGEGALQADQGWSWQGNGPSAQYARSERLLAGGQHQRLAETTFRSGDLITGSNIRLKLAIMADRLLLREHPTMLLILSSEQGGQTQAQEAIAAFRKATGPLDRWMDGIARLR